MKTKIFIGLFIIHSIWIGCQNHSGEISMYQQDNNSITDLYGEIRISGAYACYPLVKAWADEFHKNYPNVQINVMKKGTGYGLDEVLTNKVDLAMISRELRPKEETIEFWKVGIAKTAVVPIINTRNTYINEIMNQGLTHEILVKLFTSNQSYTWGEILDIDSDEPVNVFIRDDFSGASETWANFLRCDRIELAGIQVKGDDNMIKEIQEIPTSIGFCNLIYAYETNSNLQVSGIQVLPVDINNNGRIDYKEEVPKEFNEFRRAVCIGKYPKTLCRTLYILSDGKPTDKSTIEFTKWILTEGQNIVEESGYSKLNKTALQYSLDCLN